MRPGRSPAAAVLLVLVAAACAPEVTDFASDTERLLEDELSNDPGGTWTATCEAPPLTEVDTTYTCTVTDDDGVVRTFVATITGRATYTVTESVPESVPGGDAGGDTGATTTTAPPAG